MMKKSILLVAIIAIALASCKKEDDVAPAASAQSEPTAVRLDSITLAGFPATDGNGDTWDNSSDPDPFVEVWKSNVLLYSSTSHGNVPPSGVYDMNTASSGAMPITFADGTSMYIKLYDGDGTTNPADFIGQLQISDALEFFYTGDHASGFSDLEVTTGSGITFRLTGTFIY